jgi:hypothetical protein
MSTPIEYQTIKDQSGNPAFVVIPYTEFLRLRELSALFRMRSWNA